MASKDPELKLRISADGQVAVQQLGAVEQAVDGVGDGASQTNVVIKKLGAALAAAATAETLRRVIDMAEGFGQLKARLGLAVEGFGDADQAMADVQRIADSTGQSLEATGALYTKLSGAAKTLKIDQDTVATVTETVAQAMRVAGAEGEAGAGAMLQFSQAMASGVLRGDEFNSVYEAAPYLIDQLAKGLGVATDEMRSLAEAGALSAREVAAALAKQSAEIGAAYGRLPDTVGQAMQRVTNALVAYLGGANDATGATEALAGGLSALAGHVDMLGPAAAAVAAGGLAKLTQAGAAAVAGVKAEITARLAQRTALAEEQAARAAAAQTAAAQAVAEGQAARTALAAAQVRQVAAARQLADMKALSIYGAARAAAERELTAANAQLAASETAVAGAMGRTKAALAASTAAMGAAATVGGVLSRALSFLSGPGGILLATVAGFAAFASTSTDAGESAATLAERLDGVTAALDKMSARKAYDTLKALEQELGALREAGRPGLFNFDPDGRNALQTKVNDLNRTINALRARLRELKTAQDDNNQSTSAAVKALGERKDAEEAVAKAVAGALQGEITAANAQAASAKALGDEATALAAQAKAVALGVAARQAELAVTEQAITRAREEFDLRQASGLAKEADLAKIAQTIAGLEGEAAAKRAVVAAMQEDITAAGVAIATYGDQSAALSDLLAWKQRLVDEIKQEGAESAAAAPVARELAIVNALIADSAKDAATNIDLQMQANERALTIAQARLALDTDQTTRLIQLAQARGDDTEATRLSTQAQYADAEATRLASQAKAADAAALVEKARLLEIAGQATGGYSREEQALTEATRQAAELADIEAQRLAVSADIKRTAAQAARDLIEETLALAEAMAGAGVAGVQSMADIRSAIGGAATGPELEALKTGLEAAIQAGLDKAGELSAALDEVLKKEVSLQNAKTYTSIITPETLDSQFGDLPAADRERAVGQYLEDWGVKGQVLLETMEGLRKIWADEAAASQAAASSTTSTTSTTSTVTNNINIQGVLDVNDPTTLATLGRKVASVTKEMTRRGYAI